MLTLLRRTLPAALAAGLLAMPAVRAEEPKKDKEKDEPVATLSPEAQAVEDLDTAHKLADYGKRTKSVEALCSAAAIIAKTKVEVSDEKTEGVEKVEYDRFKDAEGLIAEAEGYAKKDDKFAKELIASTKELVKETPRGAKGGPKALPFTIKSKNVSDFKVTFKAHEEARVTAKIFFPKVHPKGHALATDFPQHKPILELRVYDHKAKLVYYDVITSTGATLLAKFTPAVEAQYIIQVKDVSGKTYDVLLSYN